MEIHHGLDCAGCKNLGHFPDVEISSDGTATVRHKDASGRVWAEEWLASDGETLLARYASE